MSALHTYRAVHSGVEKLAPGYSLPRHRHTAGYATVVLAGAFVESSFAGRFAVAPGDVLLHGRFDCHANFPLGRNGLEILRLPWFDDGLEGHFRIRDPEALVRSAESDPMQATRELMLEIEAPPVREHHWTERLAGALANETSLCLGTWAEQQNIAPETLSRGFGRVFGTSPKLFRMEARARRALHMLSRTHKPLTVLAHELGFSDLAHMSHSVQALTGFAPSRWRSAAHERLLGQLPTSR
ncbi:MAG TPA: AraC family transcriptional regulator [Steroidobacteraceae bacterium]|nr:AraC family transcriptional regulator [Steroidobacteraceae bacterium]